MLARKVGSLLRHWPRWCLLLVVGRHFDVVDEFRRCEADFPRGRARSATGSEEDVFEFRRHGGGGGGGKGDQRGRAKDALRSAPVDIVLILLCVSAGLLLARRVVRPDLVDTFVSTGIALGAVGVVIGFLFGVTGIHDEAKRAQAIRSRLRAASQDGDAVSSSAFYVLSSALQNAVLLGCFILSTAPFTLPWLLAYFFPFELLCFAVCFTVVLEMGAQVSRLCHAPPGAKENYASEHEDADNAGAVQDAAAPCEPVGEGGASADHRKALIAYLLSDSGREWCGAFIVLESGVIACASVLSFVWETLVLWNIPASASSEMASPHATEYPLPHPQVVLSNSTKHFAGLDWELSYIIVLCGVVSTSAFLQAFWMTYAAGGRWLHFANDWAFFQPLRGGSSFVILQVVSWSMYGTCLSLSAERLAPVILGALSSAFGMQLSSDLIRIASNVLWVLGSLARGLGLSHLPPGGVGALYIVADAVMVLSLSQFKRFERDKGFVREIVPTKERGVRVQSLVKEREAREGHFVSWMRDVLRTTVMTLLAFCSVKPELILVGISVALFNLTGDATSAVYAVCTLGAIYATTYLGMPSITGSRRLARGSFLFRIVEDHFSLSMVRTTEKPWDPEQEYICGYHPHGLVPLGAAYMKMTSQWAELLPDVLPYTLSASITHQVPILRDFVQLSGGLEVSKKGLWGGLNRFRSVVLVPGGQHEMLLAPTSELEGIEEPISTKHKGFVRIAFRRAARQPDRKVHLVPIFAFGDRKALRNVPGLSKGVQRWFVRRMRTNPAMFPIGRYSLPCVPDRGPVTIVLGDPIEIPVLKGGERAIPTEDQVELFHRRYYSRLKDIFDQHKRVHGNEYETAKMVFEPPLETISEADFETRWTRVANDFDNEDEEDALDFEREIDDSIYVWPWREQIIVVFILLFCCLGPIAALSSVTVGVGTTNCTLPSA